MLFNSLDPRTADPTRWNIAVVLPTRDEHASLENVIEEIRAAFRLQRLRPPVILITDDSHDDTREIARRLEVVVVIGGGKGLGFAMFQGLMAALAFDPDVILSLDADGQSDPGEIQKMLDPIAKGEA